jgi:hypothetical protein
MNDIQRLTRTITENTRELAARFQFLAACSPIKYSVNPGDLITDYRGTIIVTPGDRLAPFKKLFADNRELYRANSEARDRIDDLKDSIQKHQEYLRRNRS